MGADDIAALAARVRGLWLAMGEAAPQSAELRRLHAEVRELEAHLRLAGFVTVFLPGDEMILVKAR